MSDKIEIRQDESVPFTENDMEAANQFVTDGEEPTRVEPTPEHAARPDWLPDKFLTPEDMAKAYAELENKQATADEYEYEEDAEVSSEEQTADEGYYQEVTFENVAEYSREYAEHGGLSEESYEKIERDFGIPREMANAYVEGQRAIQINRSMEIMDSVGGAAEYKAMVQWGANTLPLAEQEAFDNTLKSGDNDAINMAVSGMHARYRNAMGQRGTLIQGETNQRSTTGAFQSISELTEAMRDPKYRKDEAYRKQVQDRLNVSNIM